MSLLWQGTGGDVFLKLSEYRICPQGRTIKLKGKEDFFDDKRHKTSMVVVFFFSCVFILIGSGPTMIGGPRYFIPLLRLVLSIYVDFSRTLISL